jgi:hypothetical protein
MIARETDYGDDGDDNVTHHESAVLVPAQVRELGQRVKRMLRITRDKAKLGNTPFITFNVYRSPNNKKTVFGYHQFKSQAAEDKIKFHQTPLGIPVAQAFEETRRFAVSACISAIWIDDPDRLFEMG